MNLTVTGLAIAGALCLVLAPIVAIAPHVAAWFTAWRRKDPGGPFVSHARRLRSRIVSGTLLGAGIVMMVAVQPMPFRPAGAAASAAAEPDAWSAAVSGALDPLLESGRCVGVVVGVVDESGPRVLGLGGAHLWRGDLPSGSTVFEIGSTSEVFTALLYDRLERQGRIHPDQPVRELLTDSVSVPTFHDEAILLEHLVSHRSALPPAPSNRGASPLDVLPPFSDPWSGYQWTDLYAYLSSSEIDRAPGVRLERSMLGMGLLGHALERAGGASFDTLIRREVSGPLALGDTRASETPEMRRRSAQGYVIGWGGWRGWRLASPAHAWRPRAMVGAIGLRSTADDLLRFLQLHLGLGPDPLEGALADSRRARYALPDSTYQALGWIIDRRDPAAEPIVWQHGRTGGFASWIGMIEARRVGVVVLANGPVDLDSLGARLLRAAAARVPPAPAQGS